MWHDACNVLLVMFKDTDMPLFPASQRDIFRLKQTAIDGASDLSGGAMEHDYKTHGQVKSPADPFNPESREQVSRCKGPMGNLLHSVRGFTSNHPLKCLGIALLIRFFIGSYRTRKSKR